MYKGITETNLHVKLQRRLPQEIISLPFSVCLSWHALQVRNVSLHHTLFITNIHSYSTLREYQPLPYDLPRSRANQIISCRPHISLNSKICIAAAASAAVNLQSIC